MKSHSSNNMIVFSCCSLRYGFGALLLIEQLFFILRSMQIAIKLLFAFTLFQITQQNTPCFYTHFFTIFEGQSTVKTYNPTAYQFPLTWATAQNSILSYSYAFVGFELQNINKALSFTSSLTSVTSSGATFNFNPHQSRAQIVVAHFYAIIVKNCGVEMYLKYICIIPSVINTGSRASDEEYYSISVGFTFTHINWEYALMISSVSLTIIEDQVDLYLYLMPLELGTNYHRIFLSSDALYHNQYHQILVTYLLINGPNLQSHDYIYQFSTFYIPTTLSPGSTFFPDALNKCAVGISVLESNPSTDTSNLKVSVVKSTNNTGPSLFTLTYSKISYLKYQIVCLAKCTQANKYPNYASRSYACDACSAILSNCLTCNSSSYCLSCSQGYFSDPSANNTCTKCSSNCTACSSVDYCTNCTNSTFLSISTPNITCASCLPECLTCNDTISCLTCINGSAVLGGCTDDPLCLAVNSTMAFGTDRCLECILPTHIAQAGICECNSALGYELVSGLCTNVTGCDTATQISNQTVCQTCSTASNYKSALQNGSCACADGYYMVSPGMSQTCIACRPQCSTCDNGASCLTCLTGWLVEGGCTQQTGCIKVDSSLLFTDLRCLQCRSNGSYLLVGGKCDCVTGFYLVDQLCTPVKGCATAVDSAGVVSCTSCDVSRLFIPIIRNGICACLDRLYLPTPPQQTTCSSCLADCERCTNTSTCSVCIEGTPVDGGCTTNSGCTRVDSLQEYSASRCLACDNSSNFRLVSGNCVCLQGYIQLINVCTNLKGCLAARNNNESVVCISCNAAKNFQFAPKDNQCLCKDGYELKDSACVQTCGDGRRLAHECDDGNKVPGDGCSQECEIELSFDCYGQKTVPSACIYLNLNIVIELVSIDKIYLKSTGIFTFRLSPNLKIYDKLNATNINFQANRSHLISSIWQADSLITVEVDFAENLQGFPAQLRVTLGRPLFLQKQAVLHFNMNSDGPKLIISSSEDQVKMLSLLFNGVTLIACGVFLLSIFSHKMIGVELLHTFQVIYFAHLINDNYTPPFSTLVQLANSGLNVLFSSNQSSNIETSFQNISFNEQNQSMSLYVILITVYVPFFILAAVFLFKKIISFRTDNTSLKQQESQEKLKRVMGVIYSRLIFPFYIVGLMVFFLILQNKSKKTDEVDYTSGESLNSTLIFIVPLLSFVFCFELESLMAKTPKLFASVNLNTGCKQYYSGTYLLFFFTATILLCSRYLFLKFSLQLYLALSYSLFFILIAIKRPYERTFHNFGIMVNLSTTLVFLAWCNLRSLFESFQTEDSQILAVYAILGFLMISCVCSIIRIILEFKEKLRRSSFEQSHKQALINDKMPSLCADQENSQSQQEEKGNSNFLKYQQSYLKNLQLSKNILNTATNIPEVYLPKRKNSAKFLNQNMLFLSSSIFKNRLLPQQQDQISE